MTTLFHLVVVALSLVQLQPSNAMAAQPPPQNPPPPPASSAPVYIPTVEAELHYRSLQQAAEKYQEYNEKIQQRLYWAVGIFLAVAAVVAGVFSVRTLGEIRDFGQKTANDTAKEAVKTAFQEPRLKAIVEEVAVRELRNESQKEIEKQLAIVRQQMVALQKISSLSIGSRNNMQSLLELRKMEQTETDPLLLELVKGAIILGEDEAFAMMESSFREGIKTKDLRYVVAGIDPNAKNASPLPSDEELFRKHFFMAMGGSTDHPMARAYGVFCINKLGNDNFRLFDFDAVKAWGVKKGYPMPPSR